MNEGGLKIICSSVLVTAIVFGLAAFVYVIWPVAKAMVQLG